MKNKTRAIVLLVFLCSLSIWGCLSAAALFYTDDYNVQLNEKLPVLLQSVETLKINSSLTRYKLLSKEQASGVAIVVHGLNVMPIRMIEIVHELSKMNIEVYSLSLQGHGSNFSKSVDLKDEIARMESFKAVSYTIWHDELSDAYEIARQQSIEKNVPLYFVGYSIGGLLGMDFFASNSQVHFDRLILFAPALAVKPFCFQLKILSYFPDYVIPSATPINYRANDGTPVAAYNVMFETISHFFQSNITKTNVPILIFMDKNDEFVSADALENFVSNNQLDQWNICYIDNQTTRNRIYYHLIIDSQSVGSKTWAKMVSNIHNHIHNL
jgi:esterase/lipase